MTSSPKHKLAEVALEFAPGLQAIQDRPPTRRPRLVMYSVIMLFVMLFFWSLWGRLDVVASAQGRLVPETYIKIVQPSEGGIIDDILVEEGQSVVAGQVLLRMNAQKADSDARAIDYEQQLRSLQWRRINAELQGADMTLRAGDDPVLFGQVNEQLKAHRQALQDALAQESAKLNGAKHDLASAYAVLEKLRHLLPTYSRELVAFEELAEKGYVSHIELEEKRRETIEQEQDLQTQEANVASFQSSVQASIERLAQIRSNYRSELQDERVELEPMLKKLEEDAYKLEYEAGLLNLKASQDGIIKDLATHTEGAVVSPGTVLMTLVPLQEPLQAEVLVKNEDVGFVHEGQQVQVKVVAYPFQKYGMLTGEVIHVGADASESSAQATSASADAQGADAGYKAIIRLDSQQLTTDGVSLSLSPGMQVVAEIHQGTRTVMEYLLSPIEKAFLEAGRER